MRNRFYTRRRSAMVPIFIILTIIGAVLTGASRRAGEIGGEIMRAGVDFVVDYLRFVAMALLHHLPEIVFILLLIKLVQKLVGQKRDVSERDAEKWARRE